MSTPLTALVSSPIIPAIVIEDPRVAAAVARALLAGGIDCAEVTLRTPGALEAIRLMSSETDIVVGAGTVKSVRNVEDAVAAGARFAVCPGVSAAVIRRCDELGLPVVPGAVTASEVMQALDLGLNLLKFFPAGTSGGSQAIAALAGPFAEVSFIPTGGVHLANLGDYLALPNVTAVGGTWLTPMASQRTGDFQEIERLSRQALDVAKGVLV
jgi:2-dehydro-3-deoxyphosphogluconate aldolase / (4S)-4-hydroxy-2-oxoglutarate aldolase